MIKVEVCINCDSNQSVHESVGAAYKGGASTVELCANMKEDGLTPKKEDIIKAREAFKDRTGLMVMIRSRSGNFDYTIEEIKLMEMQIINAAEAGADGIVFGVVKNEVVDLASLKILISAAKENNLKVTFHRAFDSVSNRFKTLELLINNGVDRILTSGTDWQENKTAIQGITLLNQIIELANSNIEIVIGGGINIHNVNKILDQIQRLNNNISIHSYSGVQKNGFTKFELVKSLVKKVEKYN
ncbi:MAG: copper homeostasis protein CutC [Ignavibacteriales bacterium]|nr:copper homeostasis protein CutC [Ignavibacteriales bacterium]